MDTRVRQVLEEPRRLYDGGLLPGEGILGQPPDRDVDARIVLERHADDGVEQWSLGRRIGYLDRHVGEILVPASREFRTDLTSVPALFTWLVPKTGAHLPAALVHDALVGEEDDASYVVTEGHVVDRIEADRIFRDAMADTGTGVIRRWIVWTAVTIGTIFMGRHTRWSPLQQRWLQAVALVEFALILYLGYAATADLFGRDWPLAAALPWMGQWSWWSGLVGGFCGAVVVPLALSALWGRLWVAGAVAGVVLAVLLHVTVALAAISLVYQLAERLTRVSPDLARLAALVLALATVVLFAGYVL